LELIGSEIGDLPNVLFPFRSGVRKKGSAATTNPTRIKAKDHGMAGPASG
jgi:hypothetical protein